MGIGAGPLSVFGRDIEEPEKWKFDGDLERREPVLDHNHRPPRIVRRVGYRLCMRCHRPYWSEDVVKIRRCEPCKLRATEVE